MLILAKIRQAQERRSLHDIVPVTFYCIPEDCDGKVSLYILYKNIYLIEYYNVHENYVKMQSGIVREAREKLPRKLFYPLVLQYRFESSADQSCFAEVQCRWLDHHIQKTVTHAIVFSYLNKTVFYVEKVMTEYLDK